MKAELCPSTELQKQPPTNPPVSTDPEDPTTDHEHPKARIQKWLQVHRHARIFYSFSIFFLYPVLGQQSGYAQYVAIGFARKLR